MSAGNVLAWRGMSKKYKESFMSCPECGSEKIITKWCEACYRTGVDKTTGTECDCINEPDTCVCVHCDFEWELHEEDYEVVCV